MAKSSVGFYYSFRFYDCVVYVDNKTTIRLEIAPPHDVQKVICRHEHCWFSSDLTSVFFKVVEKTHSVSPRIAFSRSKNVKVCNLNEVVLA